MERKKVLGFWDMLLFSFCAIFGVEAIAITAAIGPSAVSWWLIIIAGYFLPAGLIAAEQGSTYPAQGGIYTWVKRAFGSKWAARTTWYYWISLPIWIPAMYIAFAEIFGHMFFPDMPLWAQVAFGIVMIWVTVGVNICPLKSSKWVTNIGSITKFVVVGGMITAAITFFIKNGGMANPISLSGILPNFNAAIIYIPIIIYNVVGSELISSAAGEMKNPKVDVPRAVILSALAIGSLYLLCTLAMWTVIPIDQIKVSSGIIQMFIIAFNARTELKLITIVIGMFILSTLFTEVVAWTLGENRTVAAAANDGDFPKIFALLTKNGAPLGASVLSGMVSTVIIVIYGFLANDAGELFWNVTSFCMVVGLFSYLIHFPAFICLRKRDRDIVRPYRVPGPDWVAYLLAILAGSFILATVVILALQPGEDFFRSALPIMTGSAIAVIAGEVLIIRKIAPSK
ncbi:MAG: APC family permease [Candidatus Margulisbacteria bacterium]|nr:APC family permease [Candidatus Margulisiibacteriota bacterium]